MGGALPGFPDDIDYGSYSPHVVVTFRAGWIGRTTTTWIASEGRRVVVEGVGRERLA